MSLDASIQLNDALGKLRMDDHHSSGLRWVSSKEDEKDATIFLVLEQAQLFGAIAVYFRFFEDERSPRPQIFIYSFSDYNTARKKAPNIHHHLWNAGLVPYCFIFEGSRILVFNCGEKPEINPSTEDFITSPHDIIDLLSKVQDKLVKYSARQFDSGLFWNSDVGEKFNYSNSAYEQLLTQLKNLKNNIISRMGLQHAKLIKRVLMMLILIKYLEERKDTLGRGALIPNDFYIEFNPQNPTLTGVLENAGSFIAVLSKLSSKEHFNGQIFLLNKDEISVLKDLDLRYFQQFVLGNTSFFSSGKQGIGQISLWKLYQFNYLPIELISHIYEDFLGDENGTRKKGVVYTPPYLVQFLIDKSMPLGNPKKTFKVLDPACGSGIFLVGAFKRMIQWWRIENNLEKPRKENIEELKKILLNNIFGCDIEGEAITLTYFSLGLALLDALSPKEIWNNVHFDNLIGKNLFPGDFFKTLKNNILAPDFDLIIGNPPFESKFTNWANIVDEAEKSNNPERPEVPDKQIALLFLEQSFKLLSQGGNCCLILPSGPVLYNTKTHDFKKYLFENNYFKEILDFTPLRAKLFTGSSSKAKPAVITVFAENSIPNGKPVYQLIFRRTRASGEKIEFEIDHYDIHKIAYKTALDIPGVWQTNFMGGGRLHQLVARIKESNSLQEYLDTMIKDRGWKVAEGWIESPTSAPLKKIQQLIDKIDRSTTEEKELEELKTKHEADWITGHPFVETEDFTENGIKQTNNCSIDYFYRSSKKNKEIFQPPHLLIKEQSGNSSIPIKFSDEYLTFRNEIIGISCPSSDFEKLREIESRIKGNSAYSALLWLLSGRIITTREGVVLKSDILSLPFPHEKLEFNPIEKILLDDITNHYSAFRKEGEKSDVLNAATNNDLNDFGELFCRILNVVYKNFKPISPIVGNGFIAFPFMLGDTPEMDIPNSIELIENQLKNIIDNKVSFNLWIKRIVKVFHKNVIFLYKPNQRRYWLKSIAVRDADETFLDLYNQGK